MRWDELLVHKAIFLRITQRFGLDVVLVFSSGKDSEKQTFSILYVIISEYLTGDWNKNIRKFVMTSIGCS
jgi:hypothetical protein